MSRLPAHCGVVKPVRTGVGSAAISELPQAQNTRKDRLIAVRAHDDESDA